MNSIFKVGIVTGVHGIKGDIKVFPYTNDPENLIRQKFFIIDDRKKAVVKSRIQGKFLILQLTGIENREDAEKLKGTVLSIPRENAAPLSDGEYYMEDLIGCIVFEDNLRLGILDDIIETGSNDVYSVLLKNGKELLIPAIKGVLIHIDINKGRIDVKLPEGLTDDEYI